MKLFIQIKFESFSINTLGSFISSLIISSVCISPSFPQVIKIFNARTLAVINRTIITSRDFFKLYKARLLKPWLIENYNVQEKYLMSLVYDAVLPEETKIDEMEKVSKFYLS